MYFYHKGNYVVVFGGRRIANPEPGLVYDSEFVDGISLLRCDSLEWFEVKYKQGNVGLGFPPLYNFSSALIADQIVVFGGMGGGYIRRKNLYSINLEDQRTFYNQMDDGF